MKYTYESRMKIITIICHLVDKVVGHGKVCSEWQTVPQKQTTILLQFILYARKT